MICTTVMLSSLIGSTVRSGMRSGGSTVTTSTESSPHCGTGTSAICNGQAPAVSNAQCFYDILPHVNDLLLHAILHGAPWDPNAPLPLSADQVEGAGLNEHL